MSDTNNNQNTDLHSDTPDSANTAGQGTDYNNEWYSNNQQPGNNGQYYNPNTGYNNGQYYSQDNGYGNGQYANQNNNYSNGQYSAQNNGYNSGQYYSQNTGYNNGQYYNPNTGYNNGHYYNPNANYNNGQQYTGQQPNYNNGQYNGYGQQQGYNNGQYNGYAQNGRQQYYGQQPYPYAQTAYTPSEPAREPVTNIFYYILMGLTAVSLIITLFAARDLITTVFSSENFDAVAGQDMASLYSSMMSMYTSGGFTAYSILSYLLSFAILALSIVDIVVCHKKGYPIIGLILFTILFKPGYFLWRAYVVKQKKTIPVLFTVGYVVFYIAYFMWCFSFMMSLMV